MVKKCEKDKRFLFISLGLICLSVILSFFLEIKTTMIVLFTILLVLGYLTYKDKIGQELIVAFLFAIAISSYYMYQYTSFNLLLGRINLFPLISWTFGLVLLREIYERAGFKYKFLYISVFYWSALFLFEFVGYQFLNIRLDSHYPALFNLGLMHAPIGMKAFYLLSGPVYLLVTDYLKVK